MKLTTEKEQTEKPVVITVAKCTDGDMELRADGIPIGWLTTNGDLTLNNNESAIIDLGKLGFNTENGHIKVIE